MLYRTMPKTGEKLSVLGFGCMRFPLQKDGVVDETRSIEQIRKSIDSGVNYFDTAWPYHAGESENILGRALQDGYREEVFIATKLPTWMVNSREDMEYYLNTQLQKLQIEQIDYYLLHALNGISWDRLADLGVMAFLNTALNDGRIKHAGFSFHGQLSDFKRIIDNYPWTFCQIQYNFLDQENQAGTEGLKYAAAKEIGVIVMEPLRGGNLSMPTPPPAVAKIWERAEIQRTPVEWALRWVWNHPEVTVILSGMNDENHIKENLEIAASALPDSLTKAECRLVDEVAAQYNELMKVGCTGCGYCLPCPAGVKIPGVFEVYNKMHLFGNEQEGKMLYALRLGGGLSGEDPGFASLCIDCGECLEKCPQQIDIPASLDSIAEEMEDEGLAERIAYARKMLAIKGK